MATPLDPRKKPTAVKIHVSTGAGVDITWADGHASHYDFPYLRDACPCATCNDEREKKAAEESPAAKAARASVAPGVAPLAGEFAAFADVQAESTRQFGNVSGKLCDTD